MGTKNTTAHKSDNCNLFIVKALRRLCYTICHGYILHLIKFERIHHVQLLRNLWRCMAAHDHNNHKFPAGNYLQVATVGKTQWLGHTIFTTSSHTRPFAWPGINNHNAALPHG